MEAFWRPLLALPTLGGLQLSSLIMKRLLRAEGSFRHACSSTFCGCASRLLDILDALVPEDFDLPLQRFYGSSVGGGR